MRSRPLIYRAGLWVALLSGSAMNLAGAEPPPAAPAAAKTESAGLDGGAWMAVGLAAALLVFAFTRKSGQEAPPANPTAAPSASPEPPTTPVESSMAGAEAQSIEPSLHQAAPVEPAQVIAEAEQGEASERPAGKLEQPALDPGSPEAAKEASAEPRQAPAPESTS